ncbi:MAG: hypothetical protein JST44_10665 [Cyanobacteria bacterium SZAS LIN-5]|nr:hypothetical protein [Cyanobacteria bacterium SZAS LIN-5]
MNRYEISAKNQDTANSHIYPRQMGGDNNVQDQKAQVDEDFGSDLAKQGTPMLTDIIPSSSVKVKMETGAKKQAEADFPWKGKAATERLTAAAALVNQQIADKELVGKLSEPGRWVKPAQAAAQAQATNAGNAAAEVSRDQASSAIDFCAHYLHNFTVDGGNKWNLLRNNIFVPMGILLLLPGALLTQVRAIMAAGNPVLGNINPLEGIMRSVIAIFLIPGTYLVVNYSIDLSNSITFTINSEYFRLFGSDMYKDAICAEIRAFPVRGEQENRNALDLPVPAMTPLVNPGGLFAQFEGMMENKIEDPCSGLYQAPGGRADEAMSSSSVAARLGLNGSNAALTASWNILCAFQMAYLYYLWFVGPVAAGLWVWPMKQLRGALPSWVEGVITLAFWSLFWNTAILLIACFKGVGETGCVLMTALHFLATASVKHAFDFAGLVRAAGQEAANMAEKAMKSGGAGGGAGGGGGGSCGAKGGGAEGGQAPATADGIGALSSNSTAHGGNVSVASNSPVAAGGDSRGFGSNGPVDKAGLNEALAMRSLGKGEGMGAPLGSSFDDKSSTDKSLDRLAESAMIPPSEKKFDGDVFSQESQYASMFCSAEIADQLADIPMDGVYDATADLDAEAAAQSTVANELSSLKAAEASGYDAAALAAETSPPPSELTAAMLAQDAKNAEDAKLAQDQAKHAGTEMALAQAGARAQEAADARRSELESKRAEKLAESISTHMSNLSMAAAGAEHGAPLAGASGSAGENGSHGSHGAYVAALSAELLRDDVAKFDFTNSLTDIDVDSTSLASSNMSSSWVSNESLTSADLSRIEFSDIDNMDVLASSGWVDALDAVDASSVVNNSLSANVDSSIVANPSLSAPAVGNVTQYGDVTTYGGVVPSDMIDRSDRSLVNANAYNSANSYNSANAYVANDSYSAPLVTNASAVPAISGTQVDANSVVSNAVYSAQAVSGNVVAAVENYNTIPTGAHASLGGQSTSNEYYSAPSGQTASSEYYAAPAVAGNVVGSAQANAYAVDYSSQSTSSAQNSYAVDYSNQSNNAASSSYVVDNSSQSSANVQQGTPVFASVLPSSTPIDYSAPAQTITGGTQPASNAEYYSAQANPAPSMVSSTSSYAADYSSSNSAQAQYVADYSSSNSAQAQYVAQQNSSSEYAQTTQYAPVQGQPSSFIQPGAPANEYYAAPSQSAPLVAALITPNQPIAIDAGSVQAQQAYSSPVQYYLANASAHAESRSVENIAPVERTPVQQSSDVVYARSNSEAYTTVAPYQHVEGTESRAVSFAPVTAHNVQHGPQTVTQSEQSEAYLSQQQVHSKVQQANGLISRMNTILAGFDAPHAVSSSNATTPAANTAGNAKVVARAENAEMNAQPVAQQPQAKKSLHDLLPVQRKAKTPPKEEMVVTPPPMSNSWFDA